MDKNNSNAKQVLEALLGPTDSGPWSLPPTSPDAVLGSHYRPSWSLGTRVGEQGLSLASPGPGHPSKALGASCPAGNASRFCAGGTGSESPECVNATVSGSWRLAPGLRAAAPPRRPELGASELHLTTQQSLSPSRWDRDETGSRPPFLPLDAGDLGADRPRSIGARGSPHPLACGEASLWNRKPRERVRARGTGRVCDRLSR